MTNDLQLGSPFDKRSRNRSATARVLAKQPERRRGHSNPWPKERSFDATNSRHRTWIARCSCVAMLCIRSILSELRSLRITANFARPKLFSVFSFNSQQHRRRERKSMPSTNVAIISMTSMGRAGKLGIIVFPSCSEPGEQVKIERGS